MSDDDSTDYSAQLQSNMVIREAFQVSDNEAVCVAEEGMAVQSLTLSFETYVQRFQDTWQADWQQTIESFEKGIRDWEGEIGISPAPAKASKPASAARTKRKPAASPGPTPSAGNAAAKSKTTDPEPGT